MHMEKKRSCDKAANDTGGDVNKALGYLINCDLLLAFLSLTPGGLPSVSPHNLRLAISSAVQWMEIPINLSQR